LLTTWSLTYKNILWLNNSEIISFGLPICSLWLIGSPMFLIFELFNQRSCLYFHRSFPWLRGHFHKHDFWNLRLEELCSQEELNKKAKLDKWQEIAERTSALVEDGRAKLNDVKSKDPHTTPQIQEQIEELQVGYVVWYLYFNNNRNYVQNATLNCILPVYVDCFIKLLDRKSRPLSCFQGFFFLTVLNGGLHYESPIGPPRFWACFFARTIKIWSYKQNGRITGLTIEKWLHELLLEAIETRWQWDGLKKKN